VAHYELHNLQSKELPRATSMLKPKRNEISHIPKGKFLSYQTFNDLKALLESL
jgi:hypothetical protein